MKKGLAEVQATQQDIENKFSEYQKTSAESLTNDLAAAKKAADALIVKTAKESVDSVAKANGELKTKLEGLVAGVVKNSEQNNGCSKVGLHYNSVSKKVNKHAPVP